MATKTTNMGLTKPSLKESADVSVINSNMDIIDGKIGEIPSNKSVKEVIDEKLNKPGVVGVNDQILRSNGDGTTRWDNPATAEEISDAVTDWLDDHVTSESEVIIDDTLNIEGAAADAKAAGSIVAVSDTQPQSTANRVWVLKTQNQEVQVPTWQEHLDQANEVKGNLRVLNSRNLLFLNDTFEDGDITITGDLANYRYNINAPSSETEDYADLLEQASSIAPFEAGKDIFMRFQSANTHINIQIFETGDGTTWTSVCKYAPSEDERTFQLASTSQGVRIRIIVDANYAVSSNFELTFSNQPSNATLHKKVKAADAKTDGNYTTLDAKIDNVVEDTSAVDSKLTQFKNSMDQQMPMLVADGYVENGVAYFCNSDGEELFQITGIGGGGGGGGSSVVLTFSATNGVYSYTVSKSATVVLNMQWASLENSEPTGNGTLKLTVDNVVRFNKDVSQGNLQEDVTKYLKDGSNTLKFMITDAYGNSKLRTFNINVMNLEITSTFDDSIAYDGPILFTYVAYGDLSKTVHFKIDGTQVATDTFSSYGRQRSMTIPAQEHGSHVLTVYYTGELNGTSIESNTLYYDLICIEDGETDTVIATDYHETTVNQYSTVQVPYLVYTPGSQVSDVTIKLNGDTVQTLTGVDRTRHTFSIRLDTYGTNTIAILSGETTKTITLSVTQVTIDAEAETEGLKLYLSSYGRSNQEEHPDTWTYGEGNDQIACAFSGFNWVSDGWMTDDDGITVMRVSGDARITIPYKPFETDKRTSGFTIEVDFATRDVLNYDSDIMSCMNGGRGFRLTSQAFYLSSEGSSISMQFKENEHVRATFVVEKRTGLRLIYCYINGIMSGVVRYPVNDNFAQVTPQNISIGSNNSTMDIYTIRIYDNDLGMKQVEDNWIADTPSGAEMLERYLRNDIRDPGGNIVISKLPDDLPYLVIECAELPQYKGDKKTCGGYYTDPMHPENSFRFTGAQIDVQGTSSQYYERKNYKVKFKNGFEMIVSGETNSKYKMRTNSIGVNTFCYKKDVASSEGANNVELAILYNNACPYKTPGQVEDNKVRQGIDGFPIVVFWNDTENDAIKFVGKYNFNNDKGTAEVFGFKNDDESWEVRNNTSNRVLWKSADYTGNDWLNDFEARYPDTDPAYKDATQLAEFAAWMVSVDPDQATGDTLATPVTIVDGETTTTYTTDNAAYRKAKFRHELSDYVELQSCLFYYLFTELFLMVDSRAKNMFPSFMGSSLGGNE